jgi:hypothetical protein
MNLKLISEHILKVYIHTCDRYIFHRSGGKLEVCLFTQKFCLYSEFNLDLFISFLIYADLVNRKLKGIIVSIFSLILTFCCGRPYCTDLYSPYNSA